MAGKSRSGKAWKDGYGAYKTGDRCVKNRRRTVERHLKDHPNDTVAAEAVGRVKYTRKTPKAKQGWVTGKVMLSMLHYISTTNKNQLGFLGQQTKQTQMKIAQYMKMSRKVENEMRSQPKTTKTDK